MGYGFFCGGDPRKFWPDGESCSETEMANHKAACKLWDEAEARGETPEPEACPSDFLYDADGKCVGHVLRAPYGIGTYSYDDDEEDGEWSDDDDENDDCGMFADGGVWTCGQIGSEPCEFCPNRSLLGTNSVADEDDAETDLISENDIGMAAPV